MAPTRPPPASRLGLVVVLGVAALLRIPRALLRWDEVSWLYAAYDASTVEALRAGDLLGALRFTGLHPPLYPLLDAGLELVAPVPLLFLGMSVLCSWLAVVVVARHHLLAGLMLACGPLQLHYAAELNDYPLAALAVACVWVARERVAAGTLGAVWLGGAAVFAAWSHGLAGLVGLVAVLSVGRRAMPALAVLALGVLPLAPAVLELLGEPGTYRQPPFKAELVVGDAVDRFGLAWLAWVPLGLLGSRHRPALAFGVACTAAAIVGLQLVGVAAPHQFPYYVLLGPAFALLVAPAGRGAWLAIGVAGWTGGASALESAGAARDLLVDLERERAIDVALAEAPADAALYLLEPPLLPDDDKRATGAVLWRLEPWQPMPMVRPYAFDYADHRHGQPRRVGERVVYVNDWPRREVSAAAAAHEQLWVVVSRPGQRQGYTSELAERLGAQLTWIGDDALIVHRR